MSAVKISRPRILRGTKDQPLTLAGIKAVAPAIFATKAHLNMSPSYAYIPTITIVEAMLAAGFSIYEVTQARPRDSLREPYAKHMLRLRYKTFPVPKKLGDIVPELVLVNAHDGTARYYLYGGIYRMICSNGMIAGTTYNALVVAHRGGEITRNKVLEGSYTVVHEQFPSIIKDIYMMHSVQLDQEQALDLATQALQLRYPHHTTLTPEQLLGVRRPQDESNSLWITLNRIQENLLQGGMETRSFMYNRRTNVRPLTTINGLVNINRGLWDSALSLANAVQMA